jgi:hypothetical protein
MLDEVTPDSGLPYFLVLSCSLVAEKKQKNKGSVIYLRENLLSST